MRVASIINPFPCDSLTGLTPGFVSTSCPCCPHVGYMRTALKSEAEIENMTCLHERMTSNDCSSRTSRICNDSWCVCGKQASCWVYHEAVGGLFLPRRGNTWLSHKGLRLNGLCRHIIADHGSARSDLTRNINNKEKAREQNEAIRGLLEDI